jgi:serine protease Do
MPASSSRIVRLSLALTGAFACGVVFASGLDLTRLSWAQGGSSVSSSPLMPTGGRLPEGTASIADVAERVTPAVVSIRATRTVQPRGRIQMSPDRQTPPGTVPPGLEQFLEQFERQQPQEQSGDGSGFIVSPEGYILTNTHVVDGADILEVTLSDRRKFRARTVGADVNTDVAVIKIEGSNFPTIPFGDDEDLRIGEWVVAVGNPLGLDFTVTVGILSAKHRGTEVRLPNSGGYSINDFLQTDAAINPGNSGGPLINLRGEVVGVNSAIASRTGFYSGYGFAIPITLAKAIMDQLIANGRVQIPVIGIQVSEVDADDAGLAGLTRITGVKVQIATPNGPAAKAGIEPGDVVVTVAGREVDRVSGLQRTVRSRNVGETIPVEVMRCGKKRTFNVKLEGAEDYPTLATNAPVRESTPPKPAPTTVSAGKLGISVETLTPEVLRSLGASATGIRGGVRVIDVKSDGPARGKLAPQLDIITEITYPGERRPVTSVAELQAVVDKLQPGDYIGLTTMRVFPNGPPQSQAITLRVPPR